MLLMTEAKREHDRVFQMRVSDAFLATIDEWRRHEADLPSRAEAVRRLIERGLDWRPRKPSPDTSGKVVGVLNDREGTN